MNKRILHILLAIGILTGMSNTATAQVTIGSGTIPAYGALLELKSQQTGTVTNVGDDTNITSTKGGLLLPRVKITGFASLNSVVVNGDALATEEKLKLAGLMVYNLNAVPNVMYLGVYVWNGEAWAYLVDSKVSSAMTAGAQPQEFSFYETGIAADKPVEALTFVVNPPKASDGTIGTVTYQWYQLIGSNLHATVGATIGSSGTVGGTGATTNSFTPTGVLKGTTRNANYTGFYRFYCEAKGSDGSSVRSNIVEVAVGCGAKNNLGAWITFMCFNLGADNNHTIQSQKDYPIGTFTNTPTGVHTYISGEEKLWGDLFQWGRVADGHEKRQSETIAFSTLIGVNDIGSGYQCSITASSLPQNQVKKTSNAYKKLITGSANWNPLSQSDIDQLWRTVRFVSNDPCAHYKEDGTYREIWHEGTNQATDSPACTDSGTGWRLPSQGEWSDLYKGGTISGSRTLATANTWTGYTGTTSNYSRGNEVKPDGHTTTLFLPYSGYRQNFNEWLYNQGAVGYYWSSSIFSTVTAYSFAHDSNLNPANTSNRSFAFALRCIKN